MQQSVFGRRALALMTLGLSGCASYISESGPKRDAIVEGASIRIGDIGNQETLAYALVRVSASIIDVLSSIDSPTTFSTSFLNVPEHGFSSGAIGSGDYVAVTIFESGAGGLFVPAEPGTRSGNYVSLPAQQVDAAGNITVPFAGVVHVAGQSPQAVGRTVQGRLAGRALEPQAVVTITERRANAVVVTGDVNQSSRFALDPGGDRLLGAIARAGGSKYPPYETMVTMQRGNLTERVLLSEIIQNPQQNISLMANDTVLLSRIQRYFLALGALGPGQYLGLVNRRLPFEDSHLSLADAIAKVGGLSDDRANDRAVFIYRLEPKTTVERLTTPSTTNLPEGVPTIYYLDLAEPSGYFYASGFPVRNEDLIYVSNAPATDLAKFLSLILPAAYSAASVKTL